ncbi:helix-turn-helix domain-containing protein [Niabella sp. CC-SYL272]|uniref:helix-turn-helix domain-containing protein n=1 Tax=Niabella agricola TaxID=2891571 RepID=UPI001F2582F1|nr:helix-turn-helix domain-containing protein [Niabella agricola]MCF3109563.1 helix-turn-helix domain-containing protein [Niabella agricola]
MKVPYSYSPHPPTTSVSETTDRLPYWSRVTIPSAQTVRHIKAPHAEIVVQQLIRKPFVVESVELNARKNFDFAIEVKEKIFMLYFLLEGNAAFKSEQGRHIAKAQGNQFFFTQNQPGNYFAGHQPGRHTSLMITISKSWIKKAGTAFSNLSTEIARFLASKRFSMTMPAMRMDKRIHILIRELYTRTTNNLPALDGLLRLYVAQVLERYNMLLEERRGMLAFKVREYLDQNYTNPDIGLSFLAKHFDVSERTLWNQFRQVFHTTIHAYYTELRLLLADRLLAEGKAPKDIYNLVGYHTERAFRYALLRHQQTNKG